MGDNDGWPLDACINTDTVVGGARLEDDIPAIKMLLQCGADPRLGAQPTLFALLDIATYHASDGNAAPEEAKATWRRIIEFLRLF